MGDGVTTIANSNLRIRNIAQLSDIQALWNTCDVLTPANKFSNRFVIGFACSDLCVEHVLRLRYNVFNLELGHGLRSSDASGLDRDQYDDQMTHLVLLDRESGAVVGTYRIQTVRHALQHKGIYSAQEYDLSSFAPYFDATVECGRACIAPDYRREKSLLALWHGLHAFIGLTDQRYLFGCCSISSTDPDDGWRAMRTLREKDLFHPELLLPATAEYSCGPAGREFEADLEGMVELPRLFNSYMKLGARVISEPAYDREFGTIDYLVLADVEHLQRFEKVFGRKQS